MLNRSDCGQQSIEKKGKYPMQLNKGGQPLNHLQRIRWEKKYRTGLKGKQTVR
jgi:hypothetical protein